MEIASKLKIQNSWVNRFIWPENASEVKIEGSIVYRAEISMENASKLKIVGQSFISTRLAWKMHQN